MSTCYDCACSKIETDGSDAEELQKTKPVELDELSEETKFRIISGNPRQFNYRDESAGLCVSAKKYNNKK